MNTPTPRTDAATYPADCLGQTLVTNRDCPCALERELTALTTERDQLRAEVEKVYALVTPVGCDLGGGIFETAQAVSELLARAERAEADAAAYLKRAESFRKIGDEADAELASNCKKVSVLREALMSLMAEQGSNAERPICRDWWQAAMDKCRAALTATEGAK